MQASPVITAVAATSPWGLGADALVNGLAAAATPVPMPVPGVHGMALQAFFVPPYDARERMQVRSISQFDRLTLHLGVTVDELLAALTTAAPEQAHERAQPPGERISLVLGSAGPLQSILEFDVQVVHDPRYVQPSRVPNLVLNVPASHAAIRHGIRGSCITLTDGPTSGLKALSTALAQLASGRIDLALCGAAEEVTPAAALAVEADARRARRTPAALLEGAALVALEPRTQARSRQRRMLAEVHGCVHRFAPGAPRQALAACLERLEQTQSARLREVSRLYLGGPLDGADWPTLVPRHIAANFGHVDLAAGALSAGMALVEFSISRAVGAGETGLLLHADPQGNAAAALLQRI